MGANNLRFKFDFPHTGQLGMEPCGASMTDMCVSRGQDDALSLEKCSTGSVIGAQQWHFDPAAKTISQAGQCFDASPGAGPAPATGPANTNVWARNLTGDAKAVVRRRRSAVSCLLPLPVSSLPFIFLLPLILY